MANDFFAFFYNKILNIRSELGLPGVYKCGSMTNSFSWTPLTTFMDAIEIEIQNIIKLSPVKSCELDPLSTWLLKECIAEFVPTITDIVTMSLRDSLIPKSLKTALIWQLLKKTVLDSENLKFAEGQYDEVCWVFTSTLCRYELRKSDRSFWIGPWCDGCLFSSDYITFPNSAYVSRSWIWLDISAFVSNSASHPLGAHYRLSQKGIISPCPHLWGQGSRHDLIRFSWRRLSNHLYVATSWTYVSGSNITLKYMSSV